MTSKESKDQSKQDWHWFGQVLARESGARDWRWFLVEDSGNPDMEAMGLLMSGAGITDPLAVSVADDLPWPVMSPEQVKVRLGTELTGLVFDARGGFEPNAFGIATGAVRGGGGVLLLLPAVHPDSVQSGFFSRLKRAMGRHPWVVRFRGSDLPRSPSFPDHSLSPPSRPAGPCATDDQQQVVNHVVHTAQGRARRPVVIIADRGRGKTTALGLAAEELISRDAGNILVTAPAQSTVAPLFEQLSRPESVQFVAPDRLTSELPACRLLMVDEAAAIPTPMLNHWLEHYPRIVFSTTVHGYEGSGQGFLVRFRESLDRITPEWRVVTMETPVRWSACDPAEAFVADALLLDADPAPDDHVAGARADAECIHRLDVEQPDDDERLLREAVGLLVQAHYRTRPADLGHWLDTAGMSLYVSTFEGHVTGVILALRENGLSGEMSEEVWAGRRRPPGHLLPETFAYHLDNPEGSRLDSMRILRIAVHPACRRRGIGSALVNHVNREATIKGIEMIGAAFGATPQLVAFWQSCGHTAIRLGNRRGARHGLHTAVMAHGLGETGKLAVRTAAQKFICELPSYLRGPLKVVDPELVDCLFAQAYVCGTDQQRGQLDTRSLAGFAGARRSFEITWPLLSDWSCEVMGTADTRSLLDESERGLLIGLVLQGRDYQWGASYLGLPGREAVVNRLRHIVGKVLTHRSPALLASIDH